MLQRTTITVERDDLETIKNKARIAGLSLSEFMRRLIADEARETRKQGRPRSIGVAKAGPRLSSESVEKEKDLASLLED